MGKKTGPKPIAPSVRFWKMVDTSGGPDACWPWMGWTSKWGYGGFGLSYGNSVVSHRFAYTDAVGPIPEGLDIDHRCHETDTCAGGVTCPHRRCCNPRHLQPATRSENLRRSAANFGKDTGGGERQKAKTHCPKGHPYDEANTRYYTWARNGVTYRACRTCHRERTRARRAKTS